MNCWRYLEKTKILAPCTVLLRVLVSLLYGSVPLLLGEDHSIVSVLGETRNTVV